MSNPTRADVISSLEIIVRECEKDLRALRNKFKVVQKARLEAEEALFSLGVSYEPTPEKKEDTNGGSQKEI